MFILDGGTRITFLGRELGRGFWGVPGYPAGNNTKSDKTQRPTTETTKLPPYPNMEEPGADQWGTFIGRPTA